MAHLEERAPRRLSSVMGTVATHLAQVARVPVRRRLQTRYPESVGRSPEHPPRPMATFRMEAERHTMSEEAPRAWYCRRKATPNRSRKGPVSRPVRVVAPMSVWKRGRSSRMERAAGPAHNDVQPKSSSAGTAPPPPCGSGDESSMNSTSPSSRLWERWPVPCAGDGRRGGGYGWSAKLVGHHRGRRGLAQPPGRRTKYDPWLAAP